MSNHTLPVPAHHPAPETPILAGETLVEKVYTSFSAPYRQRIGREDVRQAVSQLDLSEQPTIGSTPHLRLRWLRFTGEKHLHGEEIPSTIDYNQTFQSGVNVVLIRANQVGKSSILKTIKFALTGDNSDYDADVRDWITDVWLGFSLDSAAFTVLLSTRGATLRALMFAGDAKGQIEEVAGTTGTVFEATGLDRVKSALQGFFFDHLGLTALSWMQDDTSVVSGAAKRSTSWLTYFQCLIIPESGDQYLICDAEHAIGNQDGLIASTFLGLRLAKPLNDLSVEGSRIRKEEKRERQIAEQDAHEAEAKKAQIEEQCHEIRAQLTKMDRDQHARRKLVEEGGPAVALLRIQNEIPQKAAEQAQLETDRGELRTNIQRLRAHALHLRDAIAFKLHFTGIEVSLCPNCDTEIDGTAVVREREAHLCRLCGKPAQGATSDEIATAEAEAEAIDQRVRQAEREREALNARLATLRSELATLTAQIEPLEEATRKGIALALATPGEDAERARLNQDLGRLQAEITRMASQADARDVQTERLELEQRVVRKIQDVLKEEAARRNASVLGRLGALTQEIVQIVGAESISDVACSPLGKVELRKNDVRVAFSGINNQGERLRVKMAFFLSMMRLGREPGLGRHPGFLLVDQPGSAEMVAEDFRAMASVFRQTDTELSEQVQILCFTARPEFGAATDRSKVYGAQAGDYAF